MRELILAVVLTSCGTTSIEPLGDSVYGCFVDDLGRTYCLDPNPVHLPPDKR